MCVTSQFEVRRHAMLSLDVGPARKTSQISFASAIHQAVQPMLGISMPKIRAARRNSRQIFILYLRVRLPLCPQSINRDGKPRRISLTFLCSPAFPQVCFAFAVVVGFCWNLPKARRAVGDLSPVTYSSIPLLTPFLCVEGLGFVLAFGCAVANTVMRVTVWRRGQ